MALIDIGSTRQLFVDDYLIESMTNTRQIMNPAVKVPHNPIIRAERPWEGTHVALKNVIYDRRDRIFRMWYTPHQYIARRLGDEIVLADEYEGPRNAACLATSEDGIHWQRPELGLVDFNGSTRNNLLPPQSSMPELFPPESGPGFYFFEDPHDKDPGKRFKGLIRTYAAWAADPDGREAGSGGTDATTAGQKFHLYFSPDGFEWTAFEGNPVIDYSPKPGRWGPTNFMGWDPVRQVYAVHMENNLHWRGPLGKRVIGRAESPDMIHWSEAETILVPCERDSPDTEYYALPVTVYEGLYVGVLWNFRTTNLTHHPQIVFSRNGIHYNREYREPFISRGPRDDFDANSVYARAPLVHGDRILVYYYGTNSRSPEQAFDLGEKATTAIGLATLPLDGFVSLDGAKGPVDYRPAPTDIEPHSRMVTRSFGFSGERLYLNLQAPPRFNSAGPCEVRVEILTANHERIPGFSAADADALTTTGSAHAVSWNGNSQVGRFQGRAIRLRFYFKNAKLYSFQFR